MSVIIMHRLRDVANEAMTELYSAEAKHGLNLQGSLHESWAILEEEVEELWDEIKKGSRGSKEAIRKETIQVAAMAMRLIYIMDTQRHASAENESVHSADREPPTSQRTSQSGDHLSLVSVPRREWPADALPIVEPHPSDPSRVIVRHRPGPDGEGHQDQSAGRLQPKLLLSPDSDQQLRILEQLQSLVPQEEGDQSR